MIEKKEIKLIKPYSFGVYNKFNDKEQWIRITEGCPHNHPYCGEPTEVKIFEIPEIIRNKVKIMDMNLLCKKEAFDIIQELGKKRVNNKVIYYELICGIDFRFLTDKIAKALKDNRFKKIRFAWDFGINDQYNIKKTIQKLEQVGYKKNELTLFFLCNWKIPYHVCLYKLWICAFWNVKVADCYFDNQLSPNINPIYWTKEKIKNFRKKVRKHNQLVNFLIDPQIKNIVKNYKIEDLVLIE